MTRVLAAEVAFPAQCELAEGPVWDAARPRPVTSSPARLA